MKDIIKYLRQRNSFTQDEVAFRLGITRQTYIKYENGSVMPSEKMVAKIASLYGVTPEFIHENRLPEIGKSSSLYTIQETEPVAVADCNVSYAALQGKNTYEAWFDGNTVRVKDPSFKFTKGQLFKIVVEDEEEAHRRKIAAWENIRKKIRENVKPYPKGPDEDPFYKEALMEALDERFGSID